MYFVSVVMHIMNSVQHINIGIAVYYNYMFSFKDVIYIGEVIALSF